MRTTGALIMSIILTSGSMSVAKPSPTPEAGRRIVPPLSTQQAAIVDARGKKVVLRGIAWFGLETDAHAPHGLWARDYKDMLRQIAELKFNTLRLPFSLEALRSSKVKAGDVDYKIGANKDLEGRTPLEVMDAIIEEAARRDLLVILDCHCLKDGRIPRLWYGDGFTEKDWIETWTMLAKRYRCQGNVIGADILNEPHGRASWGTGDVRTDWRLAAERGGNAIHRANPHWLIFVEGVEKNVPGQRLETHWWGGNLEGVRNAPVRLAVANKLVYTAHEYGPGVHDAKWFSDANFPDNLLERWETGFHYIARKQIAPVLIGEFGGRRTDDRSKEGIWQRQLVRFIKKHELSFTYWCWNPNSDDTGGLLDDDWKMVRADKLRLLSELLEP